MLPRAESERLRELRDIRRKIEPVGLFERLVATAYYGDKVAARGLYKDDDGAVAIVVAEERETMERHSHKQREWLIVMVGGIRVRWNGAETFYGQGQACEIPPGKPHKVTFAKGTRIIAVTIPADDGFPDVPG